MTDHTKSQSHENRDPERSSQERRALEELIAAGEVVGVLAFKKPLTPAEMEIAKDAYETGIQHGQRAAESDLQAVRLERDDWKTRAVRLDAKLAAEVESADELLAEREELEAQRDRARKEVEHYKYEVVPDYVMQLEELSAEIERLSKVVVLCPKCSEREELEAVRDAAQQYVETKRKFGAWNTDALERALSQATKRER